MVLRGCGEEKLEARGAMVELVAGDRRLSWKRGGGGGGGGRE